MARLARILVPGLPHHVTARGDRRAGGGGSAQAVQMPTPVRSSQPAHIAPYAPGGIHTRRRQLYACGVCALGV